MSATEHVVVCYTGADPVTGERRPPAAPLADLIDAVTATVENGQQVVTRQPLQPFDPANFASNNPFSFDTHAHAAAQAAQQPPAPARPFLPGPLPAVTPATSTWTTSSSSSPTRHWRFSGSGSASRFPARTPTSTTICRWR